MALRRRADKDKPAAAPPVAPAGGYLSELMQFIKKGTVIPIISNSMRIEQIFRDEQSLLDQISDTAEFSDEDLTIDEQLTKEWAQEIEYPMSDDHNLARVAQYYQVKIGDSELANTHYLKFLTDYLLENEEDERYASIASQLQNNETPFSKAVTDLGYPRFPEGMDDPLCILAKLPFKIYITTSHFNFIEQALEAEGKKPHTQVCFWSGTKIGVNLEHVRGPQDPDYEPSDTKPIVYHIFGLEDYPHTLVLSEDDYMEFLIKVSQDNDTQNPIVPLRLREGLAVSRLLLLGYHSKDWDFRVLFRFLLRYRGIKSAPKSMLIQLKPGMNQMGDKKKSEEYLKKYFNENQFEVDWTQPERFIKKLWSEWEKYRKVQQ